MMNTTGGRQARCSPFGPDYIMKTSQILQPPTAALINLELAKRGIELEIKKRSIELEIEPV